MSHRPLQQQRADDAASGALLATSGTERARSYVVTESWRRKRSLFAGLTTAPNPNDYDGLVVEPITKYIGACAERKEQLSPARLVVESAAFFR